ncbi:MAG: hypothetical protein Q7U04_02245 [Bacteriovorax sp.]|nr:hypothetical protein [Bacteriovorax sp.]
MRSSILSKIVYCLLLLVVLSFSIIDKNAIAYSVANCSICSTKCTSLGKVVDTCEPGFFPNYICLCIFAPY